MKTLRFLFFLALGICASAHADVAFKVYTNDVSGIPNGWPLTLPRTIGGTNAPAATNEVVMTETELAEHMARLKPAKDAWNALRKDKAPVEWSARAFDIWVEKIAPGAWDRLAEASESLVLSAEVRRLLRSAIRQSAKAVTIINTDPDTVAFFDLAVAVGVVTRQEADRILNP